ncbi:MAG: thiamine phosphate synthase [Bacteroidetes bacterium]|nr:thiamine phosphate synthase [Bacteroidota bacterium]
MASLGRLYFLTMDEGPVDYVRQVELACQAGIRWIQLRMKLATDEEVRDTALEVKKITAAYGATFILNDRVAIAAEVDVDGVHVGKLDMPVSEARLLLGKDKIIGGTANTIEDIREHYRQGADYIGLGPYRYTTTKKNLSPVLGLEGYRRILTGLAEEGISIPVIAIGGIIKEDAEALFGVGLHGIAFSGMLVHAQDGVKVIQDINKILC